MKKFEELVTLINTKHPEWKTLSVRGLRDISNYSLDASRQALNVVRPNKIQTPKQKTVKKVQSYSSSNDVIDDPDELLMSVAIRELNRANPDPRWASILISCKKENISNKSEVLDKFNQLPTQALVNLLSKSLQEEH